MVHGERAPEREAYPRLRVALVSSSGVDFPRNTFATSMCPRKSLRSANTPAPP